jgi:cell division transport system permease protein
VQKLLDTRPFTYASRYVTKEEAAFAFKREMGEDFEAILEANPLLPSIELRVHPRFANNASLEDIEKSLLEMDIVEEVHYQKSLVESINENAREIALVLLVAASVLMLISFTLIRNTIHLTVYARRFLIKTMQLVGARRGFIARPFLGGSAWRGFTAALLANVVLLTGAILLEDRYGKVLEYNFVQEEAIVATVVVVLVSGILLSMLSAWISVRRYLNRDLNDLYI